MIGMYSRRPHPTLAEYDYDVVELNTKVRHELMISRDVKEEELIEVIAEHLKTYEEVYPKTRSEEFWAWIKEKRRDRRGGTE